MLVRLKGNPNPGKTGPLRSTIEFYLLRVTVYVMDE